MPELRTDLPTAAGYFMPSAWDAHERTFMGWPTRTEEWGDRLTNATVAFAALAKAVKVFENIHIYLPEEMHNEVRFQLGRDADLRPADGVQTWLGDSGPNFLIDGRGGRAAVLWRFNGWGNRWHDFEASATFAGELAELYAYPCFDGRTVLERNCLEFDAVGTLLTTESALMNDDRNPNLDKQQLEERLALTIGARRIIWLAQGLVGDAADGQVGNVARFAGPQKLLCAVASAKDDPNADNLALNRGILERSLDALARPMEIIDLPLPKPFFDAKGAPVARSYLSFYLLNDGLIVPAYDDPGDAIAQAILQDVFPKRKLQVVAANEFAQVGGSISRACLALPRKEVI